jgi:hypothetical protein
MVTLYKVLKPKIKKLTRKPQALLKCVAIQCNRYSHLLVVSAGIDKLKKQTILSTKIPTTQMA